MKKIIALFTVLSLCFSGVALAKPRPDQNGGFMGNNMSQGRCTNSSTDCPNAQMGGFNGSASSPVSTVEQTKQMNDDQRVVLRGYIIQSLGGEDYLFKDSTGTIQVEIDHNRWRGQVITPNDLVEIYGEVDKGWKSIEIDVKRIIRVNEDK